MGAPACHPAPPHLTSSILLFAPPRLAVSGVHGPANLPLDTWPFLIWMLLPETHNISLYLVNSNSFLRSQLKHLPFRRCLLGPLFPLWSPSHKLSQFSCMSSSQCGIMHVLVWLFVHCLHCFSRDLKWDCVCLGSQICSPNSV